MLVCGESTFAHANAFSETRPLFVEYAWNYWAYHLRASDVQLKQFNLEHSVDRMLYLVHRHTLSFLGALHWGFEFAGYGGQKGYSRLLLGAAPVVYGWGTLALDPLSALIAQWAGFTGLWYADLRVTGAGWSELNCRGA